MITAFKIHAMAVTAELPPIEAEIGKAIAVVAACGSIDSIAVLLKPTNFETPTIAVNEITEPTTNAAKISTQYFFNNVVAFI
jgi:hypothetical protein